jgi:type III pantothenate kinase
VIFVADVGNTETTLGVFAGDALRAHWRIMTDVARTADEFVALLHTLFATEGLATDAVRGIAIGSVVPPVTNPLAEGCGRLFRTPPLIVDGRSPLPIILRVDEPLTVGADRLINTLAASRLHHRDSIVVDLGTATTFDCITAEGEFLGGVIAPGIRTSADTLFKRTSKLPATELQMPTGVIGKRTEECIRAGVMFGAADSIDGIVRRIKKVWPGGQIPLVIATGGLAEVLQPLCEEFDLVEPFLTLHGLRIAYGLLAMPARAAKGAARRAVGRRKR